MPDVGASACQADVLTNTLPLAKLKLQMVRLCQRSRPTLGRCVVLHNNKWCMLFQMIVLKIYL